MHGDPRGSHEKAKSAAQEAKPPLGTGSITKKVTGKRAQVNLNEREQVQGKRDSKAKGENHSGGDDIQSPRGDLGPRWLPHVRRRESRRTFKS